MKIYPQNEAAEKFYPHMQTRPAILYPHQKISAKYLKICFNQSYQQGVAALNIIFYLLFKILFIVCFPKGKGRLKRKGIFSKN